MELTYEDVLMKVGKFGLYQKLLFVALSLYPFIHGMHTCSWNFLVPSHSHWCTIPALMNYSHEQQKYISIPYKAKEEVYDSCYYFDLPWEIFSSSDFESWNRTAMTENAGQQKCGDWIFDQTYFTSTVTSEVRKQYFLYFCN